MKKIITLFVFLFLLSGTTFAYDFSKKDIELIDQITSITKSKTDSYKNTVIKNIKKLTIKYKANTRVKSILEESINTIESGNYLYSFDMAYIDKQYDPCEGKYEKADKNITNKIKTFFNFMKAGNYSSAIKSTKIENESSIYASNILNHLFPHCSAFYHPLAFSVNSNGINVFIKAGNGMPSVPNDSYYFGHIWIYNNKIYIKDQLIENYFNNSFGMEYEKNMNNGELEGVDRSTKILNYLESETIKGFKNGKFKNKLIQSDYNKFITGLKLKGYKTEIIIPASEIKGLTK